MCPTRNGLIYFSGFLQWLLLLHHRQQLESSKITNLESINRPIVLSFNRPFLPPPAHRHGITHNSLQLDKICRRAWCSFKNIHNYSNLKSTKFIWPTQNRRATVHTGMICSTIILASMYDDHLMVKIVISVLLLLLLIIMAGSEGWLVSVGWLSPPVPPTYSTLNSTEKKNFFFTSDIAPQLSLFFSVHCRTLLLNPRYYHTWVLFPTDWVVLSSSARSCSSKWREAVQSSEWGSAEAGDRSTAHLPASN